MSELPDPKRPRPAGDTGPYAPAESALRTPRNADGRDTIVTAPPETGAAQGPPDADLTPPPAERRSQTGTGRKAPTETTLVSVPTPADQAELELEDRLADCERKIDSLEDRLRSLEGRPAGAGGTEPGWLVWVVFLLALAVAWQLFQGRG